MSMPYRPYFSVSNAPSLTVTPDVQIMLKLN